jgi:hypothetical protein
MSDRIFIGSVQKELAKGTPGGALCFQTEMRQLSDNWHIGLSEHQGTERGGIYNSTGHAD